MPVLFQRPATGGAVRLVGRHESHEVGQRNCNMRRLGISVPVGDHEINRCECRREPAERANNRRAGHRLWALSGVTGTPMISEQCVMSCYVCQAAGRASLTGINSPLIGVPVALFPDLHFDATDTERQRNLWVSGSTSRLVFGSALKGDQAVKNQRRRRVTHQTIFVGWHPTTSSVATPPSLLSWRPSLPRRSPGTDLHRPNRRPLLS